MSNMGKDKLSTKIKRLMTMRIEPRSQSSEKIVVHGSQREQEDWREKEVRSILDTTEKSGAKSIDQKN